MKLYKILIFICLISSCQNNRLGRELSALENENLIDLSCNQLNSNLEDLNNHQTYNYDSNELSQWMRSSQKIKGVAIVIHGLNLKPSKMNSLASVLNDEGIDVLRTSLTGHKGSQKEGLHTSRESWKKEFQVHYCLAANEAELNQVPLYFVGFSLGALVGLDYLNSLEESSLQKMILIAPAINIHWYSKIPGKLSWLNSRMSLPSKNLKEYRSQVSTSLSSYRAMRVARESLSKMKSKTINIPTLVFIDPDDELVNLQKLQDRIKTHNLSKWKINTVSNIHSTLKKNFHHLIIDKPSLGKKEWEKMKKKIAKHLK